jgi:hypothetical protein
LHLDGTQVNHLDFVVAPMVHTETGAGAAPRVYGLLGP